MTCQVRFSLTAVDGSVEGVARFDFWTTLVAWHMLTIGKFFKGQICAVLQHGNLRSSAILPACCTEKHYKNLRRSLKFKKSAQIFKKNLRSTSTILFILSFLYVILF